MSDLPPDPCIEHHVAWIDRQPIQAVLLGIALLSFVLVLGVMKPLVDIGARQNERARERARVECLARGGQVQESQYGRYEGCIYGTKP